MLSQRKSGIILGYANIVVKNVVNLVYTPLLLSFVGQAEYGVFQTANSFVYTLTLLSFGFSGAYVRFYTQRKINGTDEDIRRLNGAYLILYSCASIIALLLGVALASASQFVFKDSFTSDQVSLVRILMQVMSANISITFFSTMFDSYIIACEHFRFQQSRQLFATIASPFIAFILLECGLGTMGAAMAQLSVSVALLVLNIRFAFLHAGMRFAFRGLDKALFGSIAAFSSWIFANQVCELVNQSVPNIVLGAFCGASVVAVFAVAVQLRSLFYSLSSTMSNVFIPLVNQMVAKSDDNAALTDLMIRVGRYQAVLYAWVLGGFVVLGRFFVCKWAGEAYGDSYLLVIAMATPLAMPLVQNIGLEIQRAKNMHKARSIAYLIMAGGNVVLTALLSNAVGYWAPAVGYIAYVIFGCGIFMNWYYHARVGLDMVKFWKKVLPSFFCAAMAASVCLAGGHFAPIADWPAFFAWGVAYTAFFGLAIYLLALNKRERMKVRGFFERKMRGI